MEKIEHTSAASPLRLVLGVNATTSGIAGLVSALAPATVVELLGLEGNVNDLAVRVVGIALIAFAADVAFTAARKSGQCLRRASRLIAVADIAWVLATIIVMLSFDLSTVGTAMAAVMAAGVATFAALQLYLPTQIAGTHA